MVRLSHVAKGFTKGKETITIFDHLDLTIPRGDFIAVMGPSGSGKSTLVDLIPRIYDASPGSGGRSNSATSASTLLPR